LGLRKPIENVQKALMQIEATDDGFPLPYNHSFNREKLDKATKIIKTILTTAAECLGRPPDNGDLRSSMRDIRGDAREGRESTSSMQMKKYQGLGFHSWRLANLKMGESIMESYNKILNILVVDDAEIHIVQERDPGDDDGGSSTERPSSGTATSDNPNPLPTVSRTESIVSQLRMRSDPQVADHLASTQLAAAESLRVLPNRERGGTYDYADIEETPALGPFGEQDPRLALEELSYRLEEIATPSWLEKELTKAVKKTFDDENAENAPRKIKKRSGAAHKARKFRGWVWLPNQITCP
jgi:hypothetical protein